MWLSSWMAGSVPTCTEVPAVSLSIPCLAAGSLASAFLQQGNRVGLLVYSHYLQWTFPGYGKVQRERILRALAVATPGASQIFEGLQYLADAALPSGVPNRFHQSRARGRPGDHRPVARSRLPDHGGRPGSGLLRAGGLAASSLPLFPRGGAVGGADRSTGAAGPPGPASARWCAGHRMGRLETVRSDHAGCGQAAQSMESHRVTLAALVASIILGGRLTGMGLHGHGPAQRCTLACDLCGHLVVRRRGSAGGGSLTWA